MDGQDLKRYRIEKGMTLKQVADKVHIAANTLSNYENGVIIPNIEIYNKILNVFGYKLWTSSIDEEEERKIPDMTGYYEKRNHSIRNDMVLQYGPYIGSEEYFQFMKESVNKGEIASIWEGNFVAYKGEYTIFFHNGVLSKHGLIYVRQYTQTRGEFVVKKAIFSNQKLVEVTDQWATLDDVLDHLYLYMKYRKETEVMIAGYPDKKRAEKVKTDLGKELFDEAIYEKHL